jgi:hypothetical protein
MPGASFSGICLAHHQGKEVVLMQLSGSSGGYPIVTCPCNYRNKAEYNHEEKGNSILKKVFRVLCAALLLTFGVMHTW